MMNDAINEAQAAGMDRAGELPVERRLAERRAVPVAAAEKNRTTKIEEIRELLGEAYRFHSTGPRAQSNINAALELLDEIVMPVAAALPATDEQARKHPAWRRAIYYTDTVQGTQTCRDDLWAITTTELKDLMAPAPALPVAPEGMIKTLKDIAEWMARSVNCQSASPDVPPDYASEFDYNLAHAASVIEDIASQLAAAPVLSAEQPSQSPTPA